MNKILLKISLLFILFFSTNSIAINIQSIEISGNNAISKTTIMSYLPIRVGDKFNAKISNKIIKDLYKTQFFNDIEVAEINQKLTIKVSEKAQIKYVDILNYSNNEVLSDKSVSELLKNMELTSGKIFNKRQLNELVTQLEKLYISKGYYNIKIESTIETDPQNRVGVVVNITEGEITKISSFKIIGAEIYKESKLLDLFDIGEADFWILNYFTKKDNYSKNLFDSGIYAIKSLYENSGYIDFKVINTNTDFSNENKSVDIVINISEGSQYKLGEVTFTGNLLNYSHDDLISNLRLTNGDIFRRADLISGIKAINLFYADHGYAFTSAKPNTTYSDKKNYINLNIDISLNKKIYINRISINGNTRTQDDVIRREIEISEGGLYSRTELDKSIAKIKRLGFFSDVNMTVKRINNFDDKVNLNFDLVETKTGSFTAGVAHSQETGASFNIGVKERNFLGTGNVLNAKLNNSKAVKEISFYFSDPYFNEDKHSISYGFFNKKLDASNLEKSAYKIDETGASIGYGVPLTDAANIKGKISLSKRDITCGSVFAGAGYESNQCSSNDEIELKTGILWAKNTLDDYLYPTNGSNNSLNINLALPIGDFKYYKIDAKHRSYYPVANNMVFSFKARSGIAGGYDDKELPFFKRYFGGGSGSVRGFNFNSLGSTYANGDPKGGEFSVSTSAEIISLIDFVDDSENMRMSAFVDAGFISEKSSNIELDDTRMSAGIAFYWITPIGPLGIYTAKPLIKKNGDKTKSFQFTIGSSF